MMESDEVQDTIVDYISREFPRLTLESVCDIADIVGEGWEWDEEFVPHMEKYITNSIGIYTKDEFIQMDEDLYRKAEEDISQYIDYLQDRYQCVCYECTRYASKDIDDYTLENVFAWCD